MARGRRAPFGPGAVGAAKGMPPAPGSSVDATPLSAPHRKHRSGGKRKAARRRKRG